MAQEIPFKILVETLTAEKSVGELKQEFKDLNKTIEETKVGTDEYNQATIRLAAVKEVLGGVTDDINGISEAGKRATYSMLPLNQELLKLKLTLQTGKDASGKILNQEELDKVKIKLGEVNGQIRRIKEESVALDPQRRFQSFVQIGSSIASGFAAAQGAIALFGQQNEDLVKVLVKVQAATALAQGLEGLEGFSLALKRAGLALKAFAISNPFTAIAAGVTVLTAAIYELVTAIQFQNSEVAKANKEFEHTKFLADERIRQIENEITSLQGLKGAEEQIAKLTKEELQQKVLLTQASIAVAQAKLNEAKSNDTLYEKTLKLFALSSSYGTALYQEVKAKNIAEASGLVKQQQNTLDQLQAQIDKANNDIVNSIDARNKKTKELNDKAAQQDIENQIIALQGVEGYEEKILELKKQKIALQITQNNEAIKGYETEKNAAITSFALTREERAIKVQAAEDEIKALKITQSQLLAELNASANEKSKILTKELADRQAQAKALKDFAVQQEQQSINDEVTLRSIAAENRYSDELKINNQSAALQKAAKQKLNDELLQIEIDGLVKNREVLIAAGESTIDIDKKINEDLLKQTEERISQAEGLLQQGLQNKITAAEINGAQEQIDIETENANYQQRLNNLQLFYDAQGNLTKQSQDAQLLEKQKHEDRLAKIEKAGLFARLGLQAQLGAQGFAAAQQLATAFAGKGEAAQKKAFELNKKFAKAQIFLDVTSSVMGTFKNATLNPTSILFPAQPYIEAALAAAYGIARIREIDNTEFNSSGSGGAGSLGGAPDFSPPQIAPPQLSTTNLNTDENGNFTGFANQPQNNPPQLIRAFVVETDISSSQQNIKRIEERAKFQ